MSAERIIFFGYDYPPTKGGISTYSHSWLMATAEIYSGAVEGYIFKEVHSRTTFDGGVIIHKVRNRGIFGTGVSILSVMVTRRATVYHSLNLFPLGFLTVFVGLLLRKNTAVTLYGTEAVSMKSSRLARAFKRWTINNATHAIAISEFTRAEVMRQLNITRDITRIYPTLSEVNDAEVEPVVDNTRVPENAFVILCVCRLVRRKGIEDLISAVQRLPGDDWRLVVIGSGPEGEMLARFVRERGLTGRVHFLGDVADIRPYYRRANVCALLSHHLRDLGDFEGLGLVLLEAQQYGVPVIGARSGGIPEALLNGTTGLLVPEGDVDAVAAAITSIRDNARTLQDSRENMCEFLKSRFGKAATIVPYLKLLEHQDS